MTNDKDLSEEAFVAKLDAGEERFIVGTPVVWKGGEERGAFIAYGTITELQGKPYSGTLVCTFTSNKGTTIKQFKKSNGTCLDGDGFIRLFN